MELIYVSNKAENGKRKAARLLTEGFDLFPIVFNGEQEGRSLQLH
ncbi:hypothetical protein [Segetibacter aerophilus]|nr:hypothetical protein [Segetibacter aerophilus]